VTDDQHLSERMTAVRLDADWTADERAHLATCGDCAGEWRLVQAVRALGEGPVQGFDAQRIARQAHARAAAERRGRQRWQVRGSMALLAAASLAVILWSGRPASGGGAAVSVVSLAVPELEGLAAADLQQLFEVLDAPAVVDDDAGLTDLERLDVNAQDLEGALEALEG
jgi:hypothetical protein